MPRQNRRHPHLKLRAGIRKRLRELVGLDPGPRTLEGWDMARLAVETGEPYRTVQNWIGGEEATVPKIPADFLARVVDVTGADPGWLLMGHVVGRTHAERVRDAVALLRELPPA